MRILSQSWIWIACHNFTTKGFGFGLSSSYVDPCIGKDRNLGFAVRSAEEKKWRKVDVVCSKLQMVFGLREVYDA